MNEYELPFSSKSPLTDFTRDLTGAALRDELEPVTGRDREIDRVITILLRQSKNNPVLIGEAGRKNSRGTARDHATSSGPAAGTRLQHRRCANRLEIRGVARRQRLMAEALRQVTDERGYAAADQTPRRPTRREEATLEEEIRMPGGKKKYYN